MKRIPVESTNILAIGYDPATQELEVEFLINGTYRYSNIPPEIHAGLMVSGSHGSYFRRVIRNRPEYPARRID